MPPRASENDRQIKKIERLEEEARLGRESRREMASLRKQYEDTLRVLDRTARNVYFLQAAVGMPQLHLDRKWRITGYSADFPIVFERIIEFARKRRHLRDLLGESDFSKIENYLRQVQSLRRLPYDDGEPWVAVYEGPSPGERIGREWVAFGEGRYWSIEPRDGGGCAIVHTPHIEDNKDCCLVTAGEYGGPDTDVKVVFRFRTPARIEHLRDITLALSVSSGIEGTVPGLTGYTVCSASCENSKARIQKHFSDQVSYPERLDPDTEYELTAERTGGRISRRLVRPSDGWEARKLEFFDPGAVYDRQNHIGIMTFSGHVEVHSLRIFTRPSRFGIDSFRLNFDMETSLGADGGPDSRIFRLRLGPVHDLGEDYRVILFEDISERRRSELALKQSEQYFRSLTESSYEFIVTISADGTIMYESPSVERQLGYPRGSTIGRKVFEFLHPDDLGIFEEALGKVLTAPDRPVSTELRIRDYRGQWLFVEGIGHNMLDDPAVAGIMINARDVSERKRAEKALIESEDRYRNLVETMNDGLMVTDEEGRFSFVNNAICALSGYSREELLGRTPEFLLHETDRPKFRHQLELRRQGSNEEYDVTVVTRDGRERHIHASPRVLTDGKGSYRGSLVVLRDITERRLAEQALMRSRAQMRAVIDGIRSRITFMNREMEINLINRAAAQALGNSPEELIGRKFCDILCSQEEECRDCLPRKTLESGRSHQDIRVRPGSGRVLDIRSDPVYSREGDLLGAVVISEDITSRKRAEELLRQSETRYRLLFENAGNPIMLVDHDGVLRMLNNLAAGYLGGQPENLVGRSLVEVMPRQFARRSLKLIRKVIEDGRLQIEELQLTIRGRCWWFKAIMQPYGYSKGINCAQMILHDITELKQAQQELRLERDMLEERVLERTADLRSSETRLQERLKELTCLFSIRREFDRGVSLEETLHACVAHIRNTLSAPGGKLVTLRLDELEIRCPHEKIHLGECLERRITVSGRSRGTLRVSYLAGRGEFLPFEQDLLNQAAACISDFIHNRELKDQLLQTEKLAAAGRVAAGVAHEINNPLGAIKNALYVLRHAVPPGHEDYHYLEMMDGEIDRMAEIIIQLYDLYKPSAREHQAIKVHEVVQSVLKMMNTRIARQKIITRLECPGEMPELFLPRDKVTQVVYNIILNAVQAMPSGGELTLGCRTDGGFKEVSVADTGPGIPDDVLPHIFEPFFSTKTGRRMPGEGMGMGLALTRSIMDSFGGSISVQTKPGQGATFFLRFPLPKK